MAHFTDREDQQEVFRCHLFSKEEPPVLVFYGVGGAGKTWLLKKLRDHVPADTSYALLDFDREKGGMRFVFDPAAGLYSIREQLGMPAPRFDLAYSVLRLKQGESEKGSTLNDLAAEIIGVSFPLPGVGLLYKQLSKPLLDRLRGTPIEHFLIKVTGQQFAQELRTMSSQEIGTELLYYLAEDLRSSLPKHPDRAASCVLFFDTFEAISSEAKSDAHQHQYEKWIRDVASNFEFALTVMAGQNQVTWEELDPDWKSSLDQHLVGGLSAVDARRFLEHCGIDSNALRDAILATAKEEDGGHHCFSLGLLADIVYAERERRQQTHPESLRFAPKSWSKLADRFIKSLGSNDLGRWIQRLALTPRFDKAAGRCASEDAVSRDTAWRVLPGYSFVERLPGEGGWFSIYAQMRRALANQPSALERVCEDHAWWQEYWTSRSQSLLGPETSLAWYHQYCITPQTALDAWSARAVAARTAMPPRMAEHLSLLGWWDTVDLLDSLGQSAEVVHALVSVGDELQKTSLGSRAFNLGRAIVCYEAALRVHTEQDFPRLWAGIQNNLGNAWCNMPTGDRGENLGRAIVCYEAALRVLTEQDFPQDWAMIQNNLGVAWCNMPTGDRGENLGRAIVCYEAALRVHTEQGFPQLWARIQNNLGLAWGNVPTGDRGENLGRVIASCEAALRVLTEHDFPQDWAMIQNNLSLAWGDMPTGDRGENLGRAIACCEAALRVHTEQDFPQLWATTQSNLGLAWGNVPTGDPGENLSRAIASCEAALRVHTEQDFPQDWARTQSNLGVAWSKMPSGDRGENLSRAIASCEAALRVYTEQDFPQLWATTQSNMGVAWANVPTGDRGENLGRAVVCCEAALRVHTEQDFPQNWAMIQNSLGVAWSKMPGGDRGENLGRAIVCYEAALRVHTEQDFPQLWARIQKNLGLAWGKMPTGDPGENLGRIIACYEAALRVYTEQDFPREYEITRTNLQILREQGKS
jgi:tetratricopeptide (TPR) repeat protein